VVHDLGPVSGLVHGVTGRLQLGVASSNLASRRRLRTNVSQFSEHDIVRATANRKCGPTHRLPGPLGADLWTRSRSTLVVHRATPWSFGLARAHSLWSTRRGPVDRSVEPGRRLVQMLWSGRYQAGPWPAVGGRGPGHTYRTQGASWSDVLRRRGCADQCRLNAAARGGRG
jgi:hypothetical protein